MYIHRSRIIGTDVVIYSAWEPSSLMGRHGEIQRFNGIWYGRVGTLRLSSPPVKDALAVTRAHYAAQYEAAYAAIAEVYPDLVGRRDMGRIEAREAMAA